ncbi:MAG: hypothetical protein HC904_08585, partial [Blastochloris sp.]|nr:hypothetical protein [Blastochloris sp.]
MTSASSAQTTLETIRSLMERATIYRAISAPGALAAGLISLVLGGFCFSWVGGMEDPRVFVMVWWLVLAVVLGFNLYLIRSQALRRGEVFLSAGMMLALRGMAAPFLLAGVFTLAWFLGALSLGLLV